MDTDEIKPFVEFMKEHGLLVLYLEKPGLKLNLVREGADIGSAVVSGGGPPAGTRPEETPAPRAEPAGHSVVTAPLVGTFYRSPSPEARPFVEKGQKVARGDVLCIIEAMKVLNQLKSEYEGVVVEIKAENGKPVEFGQPLFVIDTGT